MASTHLLLIGYRGCGKSGVGKLLSELLDRDLIDTDIAIETSEGKTIAEIFAEVGEEGFRDLESNQITNLDSLKESAIISLGGGAILRPENRRCIRNLGKTVWLQATPETIFERISNDETTQSRRPKLSNLSDRDEIRSILEMRVPWYKEVADLAVSTDGVSMERVAKTIVDWHQRIT
ncbi:MAG TPA: shikimate kinase [Pirellula sp.]|nr:shikimate kinase [Pirellula sp.]